jgi:siroheme synthase-like protein
VSARFDLPLVLDGNAVHALVVGGGKVATRKVSALRGGNATVRVRAPRISDDLRERAAADDGIVIECVAYDARAIGDALLVIAATDNPAVNARIAADARRAGRLVVVADDPAAGNCVMPAVHRADDLLVAVASGGVPGASKRIRDDLARKLDRRYARALRALAGLRARLLARDDRQAWNSAASVLLGEDFCETVENGAFEERLAAWR